MAYNPSDSGIIPNRLSPCWYVEQIQYGSVLVVSLSCRAADRSEFDRRAETM